MRMATKPTARTPTASTPTLSAPTASISDAYAIVIADLTRRRDDLDRAIRQLEAMAAGNISATSDTGKPPMGNPASPRTGGHGKVGGKVGGNGAFTGMKVAEAVKALLSRHGGPMSPADIAAGLAAGGLRIAGTNTVTSVLNRRRREVGDVESPGRGLWTLAEPAPDDRAEANSAEEDIADMPAMTGEPPLRIPVAAHAIGHDETADTETDSGGETRHAAPQAPRMPARPAPPPWQPPVFNMETPAQD